MSRMRRGLVLLSIVALLAANIPMSAQEPAIRSSQEAPLAGRLADVLVGQIPEAARVFEDAKNETAAKEKALQDLVVQLMAPCANDCTDGDCENCEAKPNHASIPRSGSQPTTDNCPNGCDCSLCKPNTPSTANGSSSSLVTDQVESYCLNMAKLLAASLTSESTNSQAQDQLATRQQAIESAMLMVAETAAAKAEAKIAKLEAAHQASIYRLQTQLNEMAAQSNAVGQLREWLGPIYTNQNRNYQQMQLVAANNATMNRTLSLLEKQIELAKTNHVGQMIRNHTIASADYITSDPVETTPKIVVNQPVDVPPKDERSASPQDNSTEIQRLQSQLSELQSRLDQLQSNPVRSAGHLEPVFTPDKPLRPIYDR